MDISWSKEEVELRDRSRALAREYLYPLEESVDATDEITPEQKERIKEGVRAYGLNAINQPPKFGGQGFNLVQQCIVNEEVGSATNALWGHVWQPPVCMQAGSPEQIEKYLRPSCSGEIKTAFCTSEPGAGSDAGGIQTTAVLDGNHYVINGQKCFASHSEIAEVSLLTTIVDGDPDKPTLFFIDRGTPGFNITRLPAFTQRSGHAHPEVDIVDMRIPATQMLGEIGQGFELTKDWFVEARMAIAARSVGMAVRASRLALDWANEREQFGSKLIDFQAIEFRLAEMATDIMAAKSMVYRVAAEIDAGLDRKVAHAKASAIKLFCTDTGFRVVDKAAQIFGGRGVMTENPVERLMRDIRVERIWEGTNDIQKVVIGRQLRKRGLDVYAEWS